MKNLESLNRLKKLFRELFQLDTADLDFGLYRLFRLKRAEIEAFLDRQLPDDVKKAFASVTEGERDILQKQVEALAGHARESVADDAVLPTGQPNPKYAGTKAVKEYAEACRRLEAAEVSDAQQADVFNQLYAFFSRYYDDGDFIPRRFFGARSAYAVPYNGEEVFFHWANKDQYYVKSGEAFRDYTFTVSTLTRDGQIFVSMDDTEYSRLWPLLPPYRSLPVKESAQSRRGHVLPQRFLSGFHSLDQEQKVKGGACRVSRSPWTAS